ncbi:FecR domain-containing protein [Aureisphaera galaxeae]|uniref:FecR family protein n=1 Tax=Aureisphaera galaxeae TaxID=1538023 RepID=UPI0023500A0E|nr:FecR domain-containing protein [Aureisphaera galaxeae]MDC8004569.1 FecR domain-containing protein [Aureisphaera galaxeae]
MAEHYETDETFLARWIEGKLSDEERMAFEKTEAFKEFELINKQAQLLSAPSIDAEAAFQKVKSKLQEEKPTKVRSLRRWFAVAASVVLLLGLGYLFTATQTHTTAIGATQTIALQDGIEIHLNSGSSITHKRFFWSLDKEVDLEGEAYFVIEKGNDFAVNTSKGQVTVLGTEFNIKDRGVFQVKCYEGKVSFTADDTDVGTILTQGEQLLIEKDKQIEESTFEAQAPSWRNGISNFEEQPLYLVLEELTYLYPITFESSTVDTDRLFTGSFTHNDLETALKTTLIPMGIRYEITSTGNTIILSEK